VLPQGLSMLWESGDATVALRARFGFADLAAVRTWLGVALQDVWDVRLRACPRVVLSGDGAVAWVASDGGPLVVKWSCDADRFARRAATTALLPGLVAAGIPVAAPVATRDGALRAVLAAPRGPVSVGVFAEVAGDWLDVTDAAAVRDAGGWLARTHAALAPADGLGPRAAGSLPDRVAAWLADGDPGHVPTASARLAELLAAAPDLPGAPQVVHGDFRAANLLTRGGRVVGVLDLDDAHRAHPVEDLAQASVYLATRFREWRPTPPAVRRDLLAGYSSVRPLTATEHQWLDLLVRWFGLCAVPEPDDGGGWAAAAREPVL
jgi:Ser/Thr protein kinase RdoA (MazF antagonist)